MQDNNQTNGKKEFSFTMEVKQGSAGNPLIVVKFKKNTTNYWPIDNTWCPTLAELEFLYKTKKMMEKT